MLFVESKKYFKKIRNTNALLSSTPYMPNFRKQRRKIRKQASCPENKENQKIFYFHSEWLDREIQVLQQN